MENETNVTVEETIPEAETNEPENTAESGNTADAPEETAGAENSSEDNGTTEEPEEQVTTEDVPFTLPVRFDDSDKELSRDEAIQYAQKGFLYDKVNPLINQLDYLAAQRDVPVAEFVEGLMKENDESYKKSLIEKYGEDESTINDMLEIYHNKQKSKYEKVVSDRQKADEAAAEQKKASLESRLASEFVELKAEFPELKEFKDLPSSVKKAAADGKGLMTAYLYHIHTENKKIKAAEEKQSNAAKQSTGSQSDKPVNENANLEDEFLKGLWK